MSALELTAVLLSAVAGGAVQATLGFGGSFIMVPAVVALAPQRVLTVVVAVVLLLAVAATAAGWSLRTTPVSQGVAGLVSGFTA